MSNLVIVAIPNEDDYVWNISSEKIPHVTLLFLGDPLQVNNISTIAGFVEHAASRSLMRFGLEVDRRGTLGEDEADVLFFSKSKWGGLPQLEDFRNFLLQEPNIKTAYDSVEQFPEWNPHLTLGYPKTPAKPDKRDYPGIHYINFDRIGLWFGDYDGFEFPLKNYDWDMEVSMGAIETGQTAVDEILHFGVKGMKWGQRKTPSDVSVNVKASRATKTRVKTKGGAAQPAHEDAIKAKVSTQKVKRSGPNSLSNKELQDLVQRMNLEQQLSSLQKKQPKGVDKFLQERFGETGGKRIRDIAESDLTQDVAVALAKKASGN